VQESDPPKLLQEVCGNFGEDEWEGPLICRSTASGTTKNILMLLQVKPKQEFHGKMMDRRLKSIPWHS